MLDGSWRTPFSHMHLLIETMIIVKENAWQYTWLVPHDGQRTGGMLPVVKKRL